MKKLLALLMAVILIATVFPVIVNADEQIHTDGDFRYTLKNGEATIVGVEGSPIQFFATEIPAKINSYPVVAIGDSAFNYCNSIATFKIPEGVKSIGESAFFYCINMKSIMIPESVTSIGAYAFDMCNGLTNVHYTGETEQWANVTVGEYNDALANVHCGEYIIPATCSTYPECSFEGCTYIGPEKGHKGGTATCKERAVCELCGEEYGYKAEHTYDNDCDEQCNACDHTRRITHDYEWVIDKKEDCGNKGIKHEECTVCNDKRNVETPINPTENHKYDNDCDANCNVCGQPRTVAGHKYDNNCDTTCNICKAKRSIKHTYNSVTTKATQSKNGKIQKKCSVCGYVASKYTTIRRINSVKLSATTYTYNGKVKTPTVTVKDTAGNKLVKNTDYTVKYATGRKNVGKYKVTVTFKGKYSGTKTLSFTIKPVKTTVSKLTAGKKSLKVNITKKSTQVTGYQVQYSTSKTFKSAKIKTISSYKTTSTTLKSLSAKKTYYVRVRTYKTVNGTKYYSGWSTYKYTKTK